LTVSGSLDLAASRRLETVIEEAAARVRALRLDMSALRLTPTADDLAQLGAHAGYLANAVAKLKAAQDDPAQRAVATEALLLLSRIHRDLGIKQ
jgi:serine/threonine protein kinase HipA of HipAB toxin-antitoxin module